MLSLEWTILSWGILKANQRVDSAEHWTEGFESLHGRQHTTCLEKDSDRLIGTSQGLIPWHMRLGKSSFDVCRKKKAYWCLAWSSLMMHEEDIFFWVYFRSKIVDIGKSVLEDYCFAYPFRIWDPLTLIAVHRFRSPIFGLFSSFSFFYFPS